MVYTITLNTAIDEVLTVISNQLHQHNLSSKEEVSIGGKAIKTNIVLSAFDIESVALGFIGGNNGTILEKLLTEYRIINRFVHAENYQTRRTLVLAEKNIGSTMYVSEQQESVTSADIECLLANVNLIPIGSIVVVAGSAPSGFTESDFEQLLIQLKQQDCKIFCDVAGNYLELALKHQVFFIKPNEYEFKDLFGIEANFDNLPAMIEALQQYPTNVAVTLGSQGSFYKDDHQFGTVSISPQFSQDYEIISTTGCGDVFLGGIVLGYLEGEDGIEYGTLLSMSKARFSGSDEFLIADIDNLKHYVTRRNLDAI